VKFLLFVYFLISEGQAYINKHNWTIVT